MWESLLDCRCCLYVQLCQEGELGAVYHARKRLSQQNSLWPGVVCPLALPLFARLWTDRVQYYALSLSAGPVWLLPLPSCTIARSFRKACLCGLLFHAPANTMLAKVWFCGVHQAAGWVWPGIYMDCIGPQYRVCHTGHTVQGKMARRILVRLFGWMLRLFRAGRQTA